MFKMTIRTRTSDVGGAATAQSGQVYKRVAAERSLRADEACQREFMQLLIYMLE